jgi:eukaryotic-like serine/threonine-protein kinase
VANPRADLLMEIIGEVMQLPPTERGAHIARSCADPADREEALRLLAALGRAGRFMDGPALQRAGQASVCEGPGSIIGRYRLIEQLGEGGFGVVFRAEQTEPVTRTIALKIIKLGMDTRAVVARFEAERQALAVMDHPGIAKVLDAGATDAGRPYFVMELVHGKPITRFCAIAGLSERRRLELFADVCRAVQHAHTKGIIHRDLKPANILVTEVDGRPVPRIIDFGIAKATGSLAKEPFTEARQFVGTPEYMSPEQAHAPGSDIDTRTDIYSLGVVLYELLTGVTPLDGATLRSAAWDQMLRMIREAEPPKPSTRASALSTASVPGNPPLPDPGALRGDLDWITMRCLEKDRSRRYQTAEGLAADIDRHLQGAAVLAAPPSGTYRARKFLWRHRFGVGAGALVVGSLVAGLVLALWQAGVAARERDRAEARGRDAARIAEFQAAQLRDIQPQIMGAELERDLLEAAAAGMQRAGLDAPEVGARRARLAESLADANLTDVAVRVLDRSVFTRALNAIDAQFADQPRLQASLLLTLGDTMRRLGLYDGAAPALDRAHDIRSRELGADDPDTIAVLAALATLRREQGNLAGAEPLALEVLERSSRIWGPRSLPAVDAMNDLSLLRGVQGKFREAERLAREVLVLREALLGPDHSDSIRARGNLGLALVPLGAHTEAEPLFRRTLAELSATLGDDHLDTLTALKNLGLSLRAQGKLDEAESLFREAMQRRRRVLGDSHPATLHSTHLLATVLVSKGRLTEAEPLLAECVVGFRRRLGLDGSYTIEAIVEMARLRMDQDRPAEAEPLLRTALDSLEQRLGPGSARATMTRLTLGALLTTLKRFPEAESQFLEVARAMSGNAAGPGLGAVSGQLADFYDAWHKAEPGKGYDLEAARWRSKLSHAADGESFGH